MDVETLTDEVIDVEAERLERLAVEEFEGRMLSEFPFFAEKVIRIIDKEKRLVPLILNKIQVLVQEIKADIRKRGQRIRLVICKARQFGLSTEQLGENYWFVSTNLRTTALFVSHEPKSTVHLFDIVKRMHDKVPTSLLEWKPEKKKSNAYELVFKEIDSAIRVGTAGSDNMGSSQTINRLHLCCDAHTPVLVEHGREKLIKDVVVGDRVITHNGNEALVTAISKKSHRDMPHGNKALSITPWNGDAIVVSPDHKVFTNMGWVKAEDVTVSHALAMPIRAITNTITSLPLDTRHRSRLGKTGGALNGGVGRKGLDVFPLNRETGFFVGYYLAEGCVSSSTPNGYARIVLAFNGKEEHYAGRAVSAVSSWYDSSKVKIRQHKHSKTRTIDINSIVLSTMLERYFGRTDAKHIPDWTFECGREFCEGLLTGYLCGDGSKTIHTKQHYTSYGVRASSIRESITYQIRDIVASLGFGWGRVAYTPGGIRYGRNCQPQWTAHFNGICGSFLRELMGLSTSPIGEHSTRATKYQYGENHIWLQIKDIHRTTCDNFVDIEVSHEDHSFRTPHFSMSNSEMSKYPQNTVESLLISLLQTVPKNDPASEVVVESTANGVGGEYYDMYKSCRYRYVVYLERGVPKWRMEINKDSDPNNEYCALFIPCFAHDEYKMDPAVGWKRTDVEEKLVLEHGVGDEFLQWRRHTIANECKGNLSKFHQEYPCITGDARVGTENGIVSLKDVKSSRKCELGMITGWYPKGNKEVFRLTTALGYTVKATAEHLIAISDGSWKSMGSLTCNDRIKLSSPMLSESTAYASWNEFPTVKSVVEIDEWWGRFLGYFMGDGSYCDKTLSIACDGKDTDIVDDVKLLMKELLGLNAVDRLTGTKKGCREVRVGCQRLPIVLDSIGVLQHKDKKDGGKNGWKRKVCVPDVIWKSPSTVVREFLRGLFETDGFNGYGAPRVVLFNKDKQFIQDIQILLLAFGITSRLVSIRKKSGGGHYYIGNELHLRTEEAIKFNEDIGFLSERKRNRHINRPKKKSKYSPRMKMVLEDSVVSVVPCGIEPVYDISVDGSQAFGANGIIVHNCTDTEAFLSSGRPVFDNERIMAKIRVLELTPPVALYDCIPDTGVFTSVKMPLDAQGRIDPKFDTNGLLQVWEEAKPGVAYVCSADVSEGLEILKKQTDFSSVDVCEQLTGKQVAHWHGRIEPMQLAILLQHIGKRYNMAWLVPERNNHGTAVCGKLFELHYPNLYHEETPNPPHRPIKRYGWLTKGGKMGDAKALVIDNLRQALDNGTDGIMSIDTLKECMTFKHSSDGKLGGETGCWDDRVMSISINQWVRRRLPMPPSMRAKQMVGQNISPAAWT